jgi:4-amino-4-deoxy-L-arabinose transferase-like glycosyltransferase
MNPTLKASLEVAGTAFVTGFLAALAPVLTGQTPTTLQQWEVALGAAALAGLTCAWHRFTDSPAQKVAAAKGGAA